MDKLLFIHLQGNRKVSGYLRGFDIFLNLVLDDCREESATDKVRCGTVVSTLSRIGLRLNHPQSPPYSGVRQTKY